MANYTLEKGFFLYPTPAGVFHACSSNENDKSRSFLKALLALPETPELNEKNLKKLTGLNADKSFSLLYRCQEIGWIQGISEPKKYQEGSLDDILPGLISILSEKGKVLLADDSGFYLATSGFPHEVAEELSALSAEIAVFHERRSGLLSKNMGFSSSSWGILDAGGNSKIGFWPLYIGKTRFVMAISGIPRFNHSDFITLVWALSIRYSAKS